MNLRYANLYQKGIYGEPAVYGSFANEKDAISAAKETLKTDPLGKGWDYVRVIDRRTGATCDDFFDWEV